MKKTAYKFLWSLLPAFVATAGVCRAEGGAMGVAEWSISGTELVLTSPAPFEQAVLQVAGPEGYRARKLVPAGAVPSLDLLRDGWLPVEGEGVTRRLAGLPAGRYRYEAVLSRPSGSERVHGSLIVESGDLRVEPRVVGEAWAAGGEAVGESPGSRALVEAESLVLEDVNNNGLTLVELQADTLAGGRIENWQIQNSAGDFFIVEDGNGSQNEVHLTILEDTTGSQVGIGTTAPAAQLHVNGLNSRILVTGGSAGLALEDVSGLRWVVGLNNGGAFWVRRESGDFGIPFFIEADTPNAMLILDATGIGVGGDLTMLGDLVVNGDMRVSSSRSVKEGLVPVAPGEVLARLAALPIQEWSYQGSAVRHIGPMAEEFHAAFALGRDGRTVNPLDLSGVALAAVQAVQAQLEEERRDAAAALVERDREAAALQEALDGLARRVAELEAGPGGAGAAAECGGDPIEEPIARTAFRPDGAGGSIARSMRAVTE